MTTQLLRITAVSLALLAAAPALAQEATDPVVVAGEDDGFDWGWLGLLGLLGLAGLAGRRRNDTTYTTTTR